METKKYKIPKSFLGMGIDYVKLELNKIGKDSFEKYSGVKLMDKRLKKLKLDNDAIWKREEDRNNIENTSIVMYSVYFCICKLLDILYNDRPIQRFWFLETVARMPYFSYVAVLHMYETFGWWKVSTNLRRLHSEEEFNETEHLHIMEVLGGNRYYFDRLLASHSAVAYYIVLLILFYISPENSYKFSELIENHAVDTYSQFIDENKDLLKRLPIPETIYDKKDLTSHESLYDVFVKIREEEQIHADSMSKLIN
tara:strand:+ start:92 stop:853 length:762 start_codon:yes stop_codon:yes gene_type:complete